jgi:hypothetical protein
MSLSLTTILPSPVYSPVLALLGSIPRWLWICILLVPFCHAFNALHDRIAPRQVVRDANTFTAGMTVRVLCWVFRDLFKDKEDDKEQQRERITGQVEVGLTRLGSYSRSHLGSHSRSEWYSKSFV